MSAIRDRLARAGSAIDGRHLRERVLLLLAVVVVLGLIWDVAVRGPLAERERVAADRVAGVESRLSALREAEQSLREQLRALQDDTEDPDLARVRRQIDTADEALGERTARVISPTQMVSVLRDMVAADDALTLEALANRGSEEIIVEQVDDGTPRVYRHRVEVVASGDFFALLGYIQRLEDLDWQFQWDDLLIETTDYPTARATISLSTLSLDEEWIGV